jgi:hypothetical protein
MSDIQTNMKNYDKEHNTIDSLLFLVVVGTPVSDTIGWHNITRHSLATTNRRNLDIIRNIQITNSIIIWTASPEPPVGAGHNTEVSIIDQSTVSVMFIVMDSVGIIRENAAFLVSGVKDGSVLAATVVRVGGGVRSSGVRFDRVLAGVRVGHLVDVVGGGTVGSAARVLSVVSGDSDAIVFFGEVAWVAWVERGPSGVEGDVPVHVSLSESDGQDSVTFADKPRASVTWSIVMVVLASDIDLGAGVIVRFTPFVTSFFWVATSAEIDVDAFVAQREFFADSVDWIDRLTVT